MYFSVLQCVGGCSLSSRLAWVSSMPLSQISSITFWIMIIYLLVCLYICSTISLEWGQGPRFRPASFSICVYFTIKTQNEIKDLKFISHRPSRMSNYFIKAWLPSIVKWITAIHIHSISITKAKEKAWHSIVVIINDVFILGSSLNINGIRDHFLFLA